MFALLAVAMSAAPPAPMMTAVAYAERDHGHGFGHGRDHDRGPEAAAEATVTIRHAARVGGRFRDELIAANAEPRASRVSGADGRSYPALLFDFQ